MTHHRPAPPPPPPRPARRAYNNAGVQGTCIATNTTPGGSFCVVAPGTCKVGALHAASLHLCCGCVGHAVSDERSISGHGIADCPSQPLPPASGPCCAAAACRPPPPAHPRIRAAGACSGTGVAAPAPAPPRPPARPPVAAAAAARLMVPACRPAACPLARRPPTWQASTCLVSTVAAACPVPMCLMSAVGAACRLLPGPAAVPTPPGRQAPGSLSCTEGARGHWVFLLQEQEECSGVLELLQCSSRTLGPAGQGALGPLVLLTAAPGHLHQPQCLVWQ